jgi:predicted DNA-binding ribbon-helix-helix protein
VSGSPTRIRKRSVVLGGHATSVSLEEAFWQALRQAAKEERRSLNRLIAEVDRERAGNLSSALRLYVLERLSRRASVSVSADP